MSDTIQTISLALDETALAAVIAPAVVTALNADTILINAIAAAVKAAGTAPTIPSLPTGGVIDSSGNIWYRNAALQIVTIAAGTSTPVIDTTTANVAFLGYLFAPGSTTAYAVYQQNTAGAWYYKTSISAAWVQATTAPTL